MLAETGVLDIFGWSVVLLALIMVGFWGAMQLRRRLKEPDDEPPPIGFSLSDLRRLHKAGQLSAAEYELARAKAVESAKALSEKMAAQSAVRAGPEGRRAASTAQRRGPRTSGPGTGR